VTRAIVVLPFLFKMTKRLRLAIVLAASAIVCGPVSAQALDMESYWYGFYTGAAGTGCGLTDAGAIDPEITKVYLAEVLKKDPAASVAARDTALKEVRALSPKCPLPK